MEKNLLSQTVWPLHPPIRVLPRLRGHHQTSVALLKKKWYYGTNLQAICFLVFTFLESLRSETSPESVGIQTSNQRHRSVEIQMYLHYGIFYKYIYYIYAVNKPPVNTTWAYIRTKDKFNGPIFGGALYSRGKTLQFAIC